MYTYYIHIIQNVTKRSTKKIINGNIFFSKFLKLRRKNTLSDDSELNV